MIGDTGQVPYSSIGKESACNAGDLGSIPGSGRSPGEESDNPLQHSYLENPLSHFESIFIYRVREYSNFIDLHAGSFLYLHFFAKFFHFFSTVSTVFPIFL